MNFLLGCKALCQAFNLNNTLRIVHLDGNRFNDDCAPFLAEVFSQNDYITYINLNKNLFENETTGRLFGQSLKENQALEEIHLAWNHLNSKACGYLLKQVASNARLITINLSWNGAGLFAAKAINELLKTNKTLEKLHLNNNRLNTECATYIGKGLAKNETLKMLSLNGNPLESSGCYAVLRPLIKHPTSQLQSVDFRGIIINKDFLDLLTELVAILPELTVKAGSEGERELE
jgi:Ran GTPase-activating protein (RanGAP) involved in mRNA processing and transport